jgi:hypothetical protein
MNFKTCMSKIIIVVMLFALIGCGSSPSTTTAVSSSSSNLPITTDVKDSSSSLPTTTVVNSDSAGLALDAAIEQAAERIENALASGTEIALVSVSSPSTQFSEYVLTYLETVLVNNGKLAVVDRSNLDRIREEQGFQLSGEVSDESAKAIGQLLGAGAIVTGGLVNLGDVYRLNLKAINVETARIGASYAGDVASSPRMQTLLASGSGATSGGGTGSRTQTAQAGRTGSGTTVASAAPETVTYNIGDTGPAGGIIFYDKGVHVDGWRYLETASQNIGSGTPWDVNGRSVNGTGTTVGTGKRNTEIMVEAGITAGQIARQYSQGGYSDWFLPSKDELDFMYRNLKQRGVGNFGSGQYWSSSVYGGSLAWAQSFSDGSQTPPHMDTRLVRAVRAF